MSQPFRLAAGGRIDRSKPIRMSFDGRGIDAFAGDTAASALLANGERLIGRSFKFHRPRGVLTHGSGEPNALLTVSRGRGRQEPNVRATMAEAVEGLELHSQNRWPSLRFDLGAANDAMARFLPAGFYYKTFIRPRALWSALYEPVLRRMAGLGEAPRDLDADHYAERNHHCDLLVVGAGPAGLAAALTASGAGRDVLLVDEQAEAGGGLLHDVSSQIEGRRAADWLAEALETLRRRDGVTILTRTTAWGLSAHRLASLVERVADQPGRSDLDAPRERLWRVRPREVILATGAQERPLLFDGNDRPGVMLADSVRAYINRYGVAPGRDLILAGGPAARTTAADARAAGLRVTLIDAPELSPSEAQDLVSAGVRVFRDHRLVAATGRNRVTGVVVAGPDGRRMALPCDCVGMAGGWTPAVHLFCQAGGRLTWREDVQAFAPGEIAWPVRAVGAARGVGDAALCVLDGRTAARSSLAPEVSAVAAKNRSTELVRPVRSRRAFVDFHNDVSAFDIALAAKEGFDAVEHAKRYTTTGMGVDQGRTSNMTALALLADLTGRSIPDVGVTTFRAPFTPVSFGALAGWSRDGSFEPLRKAPMDAWAESQGAEFEAVGQWRRASCFPRRGEDRRAAVSRECLTVRARVGMLDASTLGKIEVAGPDAAEFLSRIYTVPVRRLAPGRCRYGVMLKEDGCVLDDGVAARLGPDHFHITTTTGGAARVLQHLEVYLQTEWPELKVYLTSVTEQFGVIAVQGPRAREVIAPFVEQVDLAPAAFPHLAVRRGLICGVNAILFRSSFTGELGYEVNVPTGAMEEVWSTLLARGRGLGAEPYGVESMHVLRAEKGFILVGHETDGAVAPHDLGLPLATRGSDFVGKRSLARPAFQRAGRKQLVGLLSTDPSIVFEEGGQVAAEPAIPSLALGHVTSSYWSATLNRSIALALVVDGRAMHGRTVQVFDATGFHPAVVTEPVFYDPSGRRLHD